MTEAEAAPEISTPTSRRLLYRRYSADDLELLKLIYTDPEVTEFTYLGVRDPGECQDVLDEYLATWAKNGWGMFAVTLKQTGEFIGEAGIFELWGRDAPHIRYLLLKEHWGNGYASEAAAAVTEWCFAEKGMTHLYGVTEEPNPASSSVLVRTGYRVDQRARNREKDVPITIFRIDNEALEEGA